MNWIINDVELPMVYASLISIYKAGKVLDVGMILKRIGAVSREFQEFYVPDEVVLFGINCVKEIIPVYEVIYDQIVDVNSYQYEYGNTVFDISFVLDARVLMNGPEYFDLWEWCKSHSKILVTDDEYMISDIKDKVSKAQMDNRTYYIIEYYCQADSY